MQSLVCQVLIDRLAVLDPLNLCGWEVELLGAEARDSQNNQVIRNCLPTPSKNNQVSVSHSAKSNHNQVSGSHSTGPVVMPSSKPSFHPSSNAQIHAHKKLSAKKGLPGSDEEHEKNEKSLSSQSVDAHSTSISNFHLMPGKNIKDNKLSAVEDKHIHLEKGVREPLDIQNHDMGSAGASRLDGIQYVNKHSIEMADMRPGNELQGEDDIHFQNFKRERKALDSNKFWEICETIAVDKKKHNIGGMDLVDHDNPTALDATSAVVSSSSKSPRKFDAGSVLKGDSNETLAGSSPTNLLNEMSKDGIADTLSLTIKSLSSELVQSFCNADVHEGDGPREKKTLEKEFQNGQTIHVGQVKQQTESDQGRSLDADCQFETPSGNVEMANSGNVGDVFNSISSFLEKADVAQNIVGSILAEQLSVPADRKIQHRENDEAYDFENRNAVTHFDGREEKMSSQPVENAEEHHLADIGISPRYCSSETERLINGKKHRLSEITGPNKSENNDLKLCREKKHYKLEEIDSAEEIDKMKTSAGRQNLHNGITEMKTNFTKNINMSTSVHTSGSLISEGLKTSSSLWQSPAHVSSREVSKKGLTRKGEAEKIHTPSVNVKNSSSGKGKSETLDMNVPIVSRLRCDRQAVLSPVGQEGHEPLVDVTLNSADPLSSRSIDIEPLQFSAGRGTISSTGNIALQILKGKHLIKSSNKRSAKRGRQSCNKVSVGVKMPEAPEKHAAAAIPDRLVEAQDMFGSIDEIRSETKSSAKVSFMEWEFSGTLVSTSPTNQSGDNIASCLVEPPCSNKLNRSLNRSRGQSKLSGSSAAKAVSKSSAYKSAPEFIAGNNCHVLHSGTWSPQLEFTNKSDSSSGMLKITKNLPCIKEEVSEKQEGKRDKDIEVTTPYTKVDIKLLANDRSTRNNSRDSRGKKANGGSGITITSVKKELYPNEIAAGHVHSGKEKLSKGPQISSRKAVKKKQSTKVFQKTLEESQNVKSDNVRSVCSAIKLESSLSKTVVYPESRLFILGGNRIEKKEIQMIIKCLGGRLCKDSHQWSYQATHLVVPGPIRRTEKFFAAAAAGRWILSTEYLTASKREGRFLDEQDYEWHKSGLSEDGTISFEAPRKWRMLRETTGCCAFHGLHIIVYGECTAPPLDTLKRVVKAGGGLILATCPPYNKFLEGGVDFAVISRGISRDDIWVQEFLRHDIACILVDYLVEYVCKPSYPIEKHILFNTYSAVEKSLKRLEINIQTAARNQSERTSLVESGNGIKVKMEQVDEIYCSVCGAADRGDVMLLCGDGKGRGCSIAMHIDCCEPPLDSVPEEDWFCPTCQPSAKPMKKEGTPLVQIRKEIKVKKEWADEICCSVCSSADRGDVMLLCGDGQGRGCSIAIHIDCCQPPLVSAPKEDWFCPKCQLPDKHRKKPSKRTKKS
eukprot:Gb_07881 [translate_table: standard]